ncbi:biofilm regulation diguanylate cyclase SiaD [Thauera aromatica]|nr:biofilm regulation diguanylate cyclase SiaD [Thauera aromatica]
MNAAADTPLSSGPALLDEIRALLDDPALRDDPLRAPLARLHALACDQHERMARLIRISDGYHDWSQSRAEDLNARFDHHVRRLEKLARISDRYQNSLRELSESLREASITDALTGLRNRRYLMERLREESGLGKRSAQVYSLAMVDVDRFKAINDRFGHETGDIVLHRIAGTLQGAIREHDICGRWGGEEFLLILPGTPLADGCHLVERLHTRIRDLYIDAEPGGGIQVSISTGLTEYRPGEAPTHTLARADAALLQAKEGGRDRLVAI